jgi:hypothetical protein
MLTLCLLIVAASSGSVMGLSSQGTTQIRITLLDPTDAVILDAQTTFRASGRKTRAYANEKGVYEIELSAGNYEVEIEAAGFKKLVVTKLEITIGITKELEFHLEPQPGTLCSPLISDQIEQIEKVASPLSERITPRKIQ